MDLSKWYQKRGAGFLLQRGMRVLGRYGLSTTRAVRRVESVLNALDRYSCAPTLLVPGMILERHPEAILALSARGVEIAVHGYNHVDLSACEVRAAVAQLERAARAFARLGLPAHGFRCPYLSCTDALIDALPAGSFGYSSNAAIQWPDLPPGSRPAGSGIFEGIRRFYRPRSAAVKHSLPWSHAGVLEIPVIVPDDLQLRDGLGYSQEDLARAWVGILTQIHQRGDLFNVMIHPEMADFCQQPFVELLSAARAMNPPVWVTRLCEISAWWQEKAALQPRIFEFGEEVRIQLDDPWRITLLAKGLALEGTTAWSGPYRRIGRIETILPAGQRPLLGLAPGFPLEAARFLANRGYLLDTTEAARRCAVYLDSSDAGDPLDEVALTAKIESAPGPLVRCWPWPNGARAALAITGDLDALSLLDYAARLATS